MMRLFVIVAFVSLRLSHAEGKNTYYASCLKKLESYSTKEIKASPNYDEFPTCSPGDVLSPEMTRIVDELSLKARLNNSKVRSDEQFLEICTNEKSSFDLIIADLAKSAYDISFIDRNNPTLESENSKAPEGFKVSKFYGNNPDECYNSGFKAAMFEPIDGDYVVFSITGSESSKTYSSGKEREKYPSSQRGGLFGSLGNSNNNQVRMISAFEKDKEDWGLTTGKKQFTTSCAKELLKDAENLSITKNKKIIFTGHSLGGSIAQAMSYSLEHSLREQKIENKRVEGVTFMAAGGYGNIARINDETMKKVDITNYVSLGDPVPNMSRHIGEMRELVRKDEIEAKFRSKELPLYEAHTLDVSRFQEFKKARYVTGPEMIERFNSYKKMILGH